MYPSALCQVWAWPARMANHLPKAVARGRHATALLVGWLVYLFAIQEPQKQGPIGTSTWFHFLNQSYLWPALSLLKIVSDLQDVTLTTTMDMADASVASGAEGLLKLRMLVIHDVLLVWPTLRPDHPLDSIRCSRDWAWSAAKFFRKCVAVLRILRGRSGEQRSRHFRQWCPFTGTGNIQTSMDIANRMCPNMRRICILCLLHLRYVMHVLVCILENKYA